MWPALYSISGILHNSPSAFRSIECLATNKLLVTLKTPSFSPTHYSRPGKMQCDNFHFRYCEYYLFTDLKLTLIDNFNETLTQR